MRKPISLALFVVWAILFCQAYDQNMLCKNPMSTVPAQPPEPTFPAELPPGIAAEATGST